MKGKYDFWNHGIHPVTGFFIADDRVVELYSYDKYIIDTLILPRNSYSMKIQVRPINNLFTKIQTA